MSRHDDWDGLIIIGIVLLIILNSFVWLNLIPATLDCTPTTMFSDGTQCIVFDSQGLGGWLLWLGLIILEIFYVALLLSRRKPEYKSWKFWTFELKGKALGYTCLIYFVAIPIVWIVTHILIRIVKSWEAVKGILLTMLFILGVLGLIAIFYYINVFIARCVGKVKKRKFKVGEKVRIKKDLEEGETYGDIYVSDYSDRFKKVKRGRKVKIKEYDGNKIEIKEDKGNYDWSEEMLEKINQKRRK